MLNRKRERSGEGRLGRGLAGCVEGGAHEGLEAFGGEAEAEEAPEGAAVGGVVGVGVELGGEVAHAAEVGDGADEVEIGGEVVGVEEAQDRGEGAGVAVEAGTEDGGFEGFGGELVARAEEGGEGGAFGAGRGVGGVHHARDSPGRSLVMVTECRKAGGNGILL